MRPAWSFSFSVITAALLSISTTGGQPLAPGKTPFIAERPHVFTSFEEQSTFTKRFYSREEFDRAKNNRAIECSRIQYVSDGLKVTGFLVKPRDTESKRYPTIVYNRGGLLEIGKIDKPNLLDFFIWHRMASWCLPLNTVGMMAEKGEKNAAGLRASESKSLSIAQ